MISFSKDLKMTLDIPRQEWVAACIVFGLIVIAWTLDSFLYPAIGSSDLNLIATMVTKDLDLTLYPRDNIFANVELYDFYTPLYRWLVAQLWLVSGTFESALVWLVPPVLSLYLAGTFILLRSITKNGWIALGLTVASAHYHSTMGGGQWGVGGSSDMQSRVLFMSILPFLTLMYLNLLKEPNWRKGLLFGLIYGLVTNLHPVSGFHLLILLMTLLILVHSRHCRGWQSLVVVGVTSAIGAWPVAWNFFGNSGKPVADNVPFELFRKIVAERRQMPFSPDTFEWPLFDLRLTRPALDILVWVYLGLSIVFFLYYIWDKRRRLDLIKWAWLVGGLITVAYAYMVALFHMTFLFAVVAFYIIYRFKQDKYSRLDGWLITLTGLVVLYSFVGYYLLMYIWQTFEVWSLTSLLVEYVRSARFIYLPIYLLAGLGGVALVEALKNNLPFISKHHNETALSITVAIVFALAPAILVGSHRQLSTTLVAIAIVILLFVAVFLLLTKVNWTPVKIVLATGIVVLILSGPSASFLAEYFPVPIRNLLSPNSWAVALVSQVDAELYDWVAQNTPRDSLIYTCFDHTSVTYFRRVSQRSITHNWKDIGLAIHKRGGLISAYDKFRTLQDACSDFDQLIVTLRHSGADYFFTYKETAGEFLYEACFTNEKYAVFAVNQNSCLEAK